MGRKRKRYENTGNIQTVFTVNFRDPDQIDEIFETFAQNEVMCGNMAFVTTISLLNKLKVY